MAQRTTVGLEMDYRSQREVDLITAACDPTPASRRAIRLWHACVDGYVSNPQAMVVARSDRHGAGCKRGRAVTETDARARGACADRVRGRAPWHGCPNWARTRRRFAVPATGGIRSR